MAVSPKSTIREVLMVIDRHALRIALIIDEDDLLLGVVTDGDVRRGFLNGMGLDHCASDVMTSSPYTVGKEMDAEALVSFMTEKNILAVPVVEQNVVVGLATLHQESSRKIEHSNPVFILAGGFGTRLRLLTDTCPKPMLNVGGKPMLEIILLQFKKAGFSNFYISLHYLSKMIVDHFGDGSRFGVNITYLNEDSPLGTGGSLGLLPRDLDKNLPIIVCNGDVLTTLDFGKLLEFHDEKSGASTVCVREYQYQVPYGVINGKGGEVTSIIEKPTHTYFVNAGIYCISPEIVYSVLANQKVDMPTLLEKSLANEGKVMMFPMHEYWLDIGHMDDYNRAQVEINSLGILN